MELHQLRYLRAVVRRGSVTAAAEEQHVAQPSISKQIRLLERELGVPLFHRVGRHVVPTQAALELADCASRVLDDLQSTAAAIAGPGSRRGGTLHICATETVANHLLPPALTRLREESPEASIRVEMLGTDDILARVLADEVDFGIVVLPLVDSRLEAFHLLTEDVLVAMPPDHAASPLGVYPLKSALLDPQLLLSMPGQGLRAQVDAAAVTLSVELHPRIELRSQQAILAMVAAGGGIALAPRMSVEGRDDIVARPLDPPLTREVGWVRRRGRHLAAIGVQLLALIQQPASAAGP
jgi:DNA-binding transcriptional LysR family regulator